MYVFEGVCLTKRDKLNDCAKQDQGIRHRSRGYGTDLCFLCGICSKLVYSDVNILYIGVEETKMLSICHLQLFANTAKNRRHKYREYR